MQGGVLQGGVYRVAYNSVACYRVAYYRAACYRVACCRAACSRVACSTLIVLRRDSLFAADIHIWIALDVTALLPKLRYLQTDGWDLKETVGNAHSFEY